MPIAAVPKYLGNDDFRSASPGLRFGMYLKLWGINSRSKEHLWKTYDVNYRPAGRNHEEREFKDENKTSALKAATFLSETDRKSIAAHVQRQQAIFNAATGKNGLELMAKSVAPFTTGLGNEHPLENGFAFLNPYGVPYLPGSGIKGVVRRAAEELAHPAFFQDDSGWTLPAIWHLFGFEPWLAPRRPGAEMERWEQWIDGFAVSGEDIGAYLDMVLDDTSSSRKLKESVLQATSPKRELLQKRRLHVRGTLAFWDVVPQINGNQLAVEIMTPHQSHYYQDKAYAGSNSPHDSGSPNPISFLTVPPDSGFVFHVRCDHRCLARCAPELAKDGRWRTLLTAAFEHAFEWLGFGAKTAVGYGAMVRNREDERRLQQDREEREAKRKADALEEARVAELPPIEQEIEAILRDRPDPNMKEITWIMQKVRNDHWDGDKKIEVSKWLKNKMKDSKQWRESSDKKKPEKDTLYQNTLLVMSWLEEK